MGEPPVFRASFADFKLVKTRGCAQLIFELPIEQADAALQTLGGLPRAATEVWAGICRLDPKAAPSPPTAAPPPAPREPGKYASFPLAKQAAIRCATPEFRRFLREYTAHWCDINNEDDAAAAVRSHCGVASRKEILPDTEAGKYWLELDCRFLEWRHEVPIAEPTR